MEILHALILGLIQGLTEFLPVSSSGHLVLFQNLFGITEGTQAFSIVLHVATLVAVFIYYWEDIFRLICNPIQRTTALLILGTIPTVIIALLCNDTFDAIFGAGKYIGFNFIFTGFILLYADSCKGGRKKLHHMSNLDALLVGTCQGLAILPAVSRSGMTISTCLSRGMNRESAARFSFLLSIPAILGALVLMLKDIVTGEVALGESISILPMAVGALAAAISGYFAIRVMVNIIKRGNLKFFSYYVFILGGILLIDQFFLHMIVK